MSARQSVVLRIAKLDDLAAAQRLEVATFAAYRISLRQMRYLVGSSHAVFLAAVSDGSLVGDGIALIRKHSGGKKSGRIYSLAVDATMRGRGIGRQLTSRLLKELSKRGASTVFLEVATTNSKAVSLYNALGFEIVATLRGYYSPRKHAFKMKLVLR